MLKEKEIIFKKIKDYISLGEAQKSFQLLNNLSSPFDDCVLQHRYAKVFQKIEGEITGLPKVRIAILSTSTCDPLTKILKYWLARAGMKADIFEAEYDTLHQTILNPQSDFYQFSPDIAVLFTNYRDVQRALSGKDPSKTGLGIITLVCEEYALLWKKIRENSNCYIIQNNADLPYQRVYGHYEGMIQEGLINRLRRFNVELAQYLIPGSTLFDFDYLASVYGRKKWHNHRFWYYSKHAFDLDATGLVAFELSKVIGAIKGLSKKCIVLDLDNTLWGGVVAEEGVEGIQLGQGSEGEAFVDFQKYLLSLKQRGIVLAVCSKNNEENAKAPFLNHPDMQIKLDDIVVFKANWNDKASNIKDIARELNLGLDSFVFIDDSPAERLLVREMLPEVEVFDMPSQPVNYIQALSSQSYFEMVAFSQEDKKRNAFYKENIQRSEWESGFSDISDYLKSLQMRMDVSEINEFNLPRAAQLINKSNQFHLTTTRYSESDIKFMQEANDQFSICFSLKDCFGDNGLISVIFLKEAEDALLIDTWVMSCRVLSRGVEEFIMREVIDRAQDLKCLTVLGKYFPTKKNKLVENLYERLGFQLAREDQGKTTWTLSLEKEQPQYRYFIQKRSR